MVVLAPFSQGGRPCRPPIDSSPPQSWLPPLNRKTGDWLWGHSSTYTHLSRFSSPHHPWFALVSHCLCEMGVMVTYQIEAQHINVCLELLRRFGAEGGCFLSRIVTVVETWVDYIERETKWTSKEWSFSRRRSRRSLVRINLQGRLC